MPAVRVLVALILLLGAALPAAAQEEPPARVGRISYVSGNLAFHMAGETEWSAAGANYPVATGGSFWTDASARAEMRIGPSTIDMAGGTEVDVTNLNDQVAQLALPQGRVYVQLRQLDAGQSFEIDTPQGGVWLLQPGAYDIDSGSASQPARVAVFEGSARFVGGGADTGIKSGDAAVLTGSNPITVQLQHATSDEFVAWAKGRNTEESHVATHKYVSPQMTGYAELSAYGDWQQNPQYGEVWYPKQVPADWAPYHDGRWVWVPPWGWTWVDQQPWGFAPFHYGRWAYVGSRWGWVPGQYVARPVYAPALVAFVGFGGGGAGIGVRAAAGPPVGWFPLAPGEVYWPSYTRNINYIRNVNVTNVRNINTIVVRNDGNPPPRVVNQNFANRRFATVVPRRVFANADRVAPAAIHVPETELRRARVTTRPPVTPVVARTAPGPHRGKAGEAALGPNRATGPGMAGEAAAGANPPAAGPRGEAARGRERLPENAGRPAPNGRPSNTAALPPAHPAQAGPAAQKQPPASERKGETSGGNAAVQSNGPTGGAGERNQPAANERKGEAAGRNAAMPPNGPIAGRNQPTDNEPKGAAVGPNTAVQSNSPTAERNQPTANERKGKSAGPNATRPSQPAAAARPAAPLAPSGAAPAARDRTPAAQTPHRETTAQPSERQPRAPAESRPASATRREAPAAHPAPARVTPPKAEEKQSARPPVPAAPRAARAVPERARPAPHPAAPRPAPHPVAAAPRPAPHPAAHTAAARPAAKAQPTKSAEAHGKESTKHD
jgi:hypothetical protein